MADIRSLIAFGFGVARVSGGRVIRVIFDALARSFTLNSEVRSFAVDSLARSFTINSEVRSFMLDSQARGFTLTSTRRI